MSLFPRRLHPGVGGDLGGADNRLTVAAVVSWDGLCRFDTVFRSGKNSADTLTVLWK